MSEYFSVSFYVCSLSYFGRPNPAAFARGLPGKQSFPKANRLCYLTGAASGEAGLAADPGASDPDLMTKLTTSQAKVAVRGSRY